MKNKHPRSFLSVMISRFICERRLSPGISRNTGYTYLIPTMMREFIEYVSDDILPQQVLYRQAVGVGRRSLFEFHLPSYLWGFSEDLRGYLNGPVTEPCKESANYDRKAFTRQLIDGKLIIRLTNEAQFQPQLYTERKTESQLWLESLGFDTLSDMIMYNRREFFEWVNILPDVGVKIKPITIEEMSLLESILGSGTWQRIIPVMIIR